MHVLGNNDNKQGIAKLTDLTVIHLLSYFPCTCLHLWLRIKMCHKLSYACSIIMNFLEDWGVGIIYPPTKFQFHRFIINRNLLSDRNRWKHIHTHRLTESDTLPKYDIGSSKINNSNKKKTENKKHWKNADILNPPCLWPFTWVPHHGLWSYVKAKDTCVIVQINTILCCALEQGMNPVD